jgi:hypothetical protein
MRTRSHLLLPLLGAALVLAACGDASVSVASGDQPGNSSAAARGTLSGTVTAAGKTVVGAMIVPTSLETPPAAVPEMAVMSDTQGHYSWSLPPGRYSVVAKAVPGTTKDRSSLAVGRPAPSVVTVVADRTVTLNLPLVS